MLTDAVLLSVLGVTASRASKLLHAANGASGLAMVDALELRSLGVTAAQTARVLAAVELGRRVFAPAHDGIIVRGPEDIAPVLMARIGHLEDLELVLVSLDRRGRVTAIDIVTSGSRAFTIVDPSQIVRQALKRNADTVIVAHNHPSRSRRLPRGTSTSPGGSPQPEGSLASRSSTTWS